MLIELDFKDPGDNLLTRDLNSGLEWLDVTATLLMSHDAVTGGAGGFADEGFRYATAGEMEQELLAAASQKDSAGGGRSPEPALVRSSC